MASNPAGYPPDSIPIHPPHQDWWSRRPNPTTHNTQSTLLSSEDSPVTCINESLSFLSLWGNSAPPGQDPETGTSDQLSTTKFSASPAALFLSGFSAPPPPPSRPVPNPDPPVRHTPDPDVVGGYSIGRTIGHGGFSTIKLATAINSPGGSPPSIAAVKIIRKLDSRPGVTEARHRLSQEAIIWKQLSHEHILPLFQVVETDYATYLFTLYCPEGSLLDIINSHAAAGGLVMDDAGMLFRQIVRGLRYLHEVVGLVHSDLKLENILVDESGSCRISDFGLAQWMPASEARSSSSRAFIDESSSDEERLSLSYKSPVVLSPHHTPGEGSPITTKEPRPSLHIHRPMDRKRGRRNRSHPPPTHFTSPTYPEHSFQPGSLPYASPELLTSLSAKSAHPSPAQDIWALGCILYALLFGKLPFEDPFEPRLQMKIRRGIWHLPGYRGASRSRPRAGRQARSSSRNARQQSRSRSKSRHHPFIPSFHGDDNGLGASSRRSKSRGRPLRSPLGGGQIPRSTSHKRIGRVAEDVLKGCLCVDQASRWTISMVDEVGWGVGWDLEVGIEEGDDDDDSSGVSATPSPASESSIASSLITNPFAREEGIVIAQLEAEHHPDHWSRDHSPVDLDLPSREVRSRSRGKRGKASRSSSLAKAATGQSSSSANPTTSDVTCNLVNSHRDTLSAPPLTLRAFPTNDDFSRTPPMIWVEPTRRSSQTTLHVLSEGDNHPRGRPLKTGFGRSVFGEERHSMALAVDRVPGVNFNHRPFGGSACSLSPSPTPKTPLEFPDGESLVKLANHTQADPAELGSLACLEDNANLAGYSQAEKHFG